MKFCTAFIAGLAWLSTGVLAQVPAGEFTQVADFGENPTGSLMFIYVPVNLAEYPPIIVAIHWCSGNASLYYTDTPYASYAETYGFIVIYPQSPYEGECWDVSSQAALTHDGGGDSNSIANMVTWTLETYCGDPSRVYVTGTSSGAMMTNVMAATYPEMFAAGIVYSGVPAGCFVSDNNTVDAWNYTCSLGLVNDTQRQWANVVHNMYPGYRGRYPRMQIYHGSADDVLYPENYNETIKQWTGVFRYDLNHYILEENYPLTNYTTYTYGPNVQGIYAVGVGHTVPVQGEQDLEWFGFVCNSSNVS